MTYHRISRAAAERVRGGWLPHVPPAAAPVATRVRIELEANEDAAPMLLLADSRRGRDWQVALEPAGAGGPGSGWQTDILLPTEPTLLRYHFVLRDGRAIHERRQMEGTAEPLFDDWEERDFQLAVYDPAGTPPTWVPGQVVYQIFPDCFAIGDPAHVRRGGDVYGMAPLYQPWDARPENPPHGRNFFGGDLRGVIEKLDYLQDLGISVLYFTPIFASPTNHRYDALDYGLIDPRLGTAADFRELMAQAGERGIRVILDGVFNHCSSESRYFQGARQSQRSPYYRWFDFMRWPSSWVGWLGSRAPRTLPGVMTMPQFVECPEVEEFFFGQDGIALYWLAEGIAGWRTDVTPWKSSAFWRTCRQAVRRAYPDAYLIAEEWGDATPYFLGDTFDATMNYRFGYSVYGYVAGKLTATALDDRLETLRRDTPEPIFHAQLNLLGSHDTPRILTRLGGDKERVLLAAAFQLAYPGVPMIYYGDEAGIAGSFAEDSRRPYPWGAQDPQLLAFYRQAIHVRRASLALSAGDVTTVWIDDRGGYGFQRASGADRVVALFNNGDQPLEAQIPIADALGAGTWPDLLARLPAAQVVDGTLRATIPPLGAGWFHGPAAR